MDRLDHFLAATSAPKPELIALRALTLHMFQHVAPRQFDLRGLAAVLEAALEACGSVHLEDESPVVPDRVQAAVDAWYLRRLRGLPHPAPDEARLTRALRALKDEGELVHVWLLGELARRSGLEPRVHASTNLFKLVPVAHGYYLTHLPLLATDYFSRPLSHPEAAAWGDELEGLVPWLQEEPNLDLAGEVLLCLKVMKRAHPGALALVEGTPLSDDPHTQATTLLALACE